MLYTLPEWVTPNLEYNRFTNSDWTDICLVNGTFSNLAVFYDQEWNNSYVTGTWAALNSTYQPGINSNTSFLSDNVLTSKILNWYPNSLLTQLDSLLVRGISQQRVTNITANSLPDNHTEIGVHFENFPENYNVGEFISLDGCSQTALNNIWFVDRIEFNAVYFSVSGTYGDETGTIISKRPPVGGGQWIRQGNSYTSLSSSENKKLDIDDTSKSVSVVSINGNDTPNLYWKKYLKRPATHYQGPDIGLDRIQWSIIGDHLRFVFVMAYKQNPKTHSNILFFGDITDPNDDEVKTILLGYKDSNIGNVGFNNLFRYSKWEFQDNGQLYCFSPFGNITNASDSGWIKCDSEDNIEYLTQSKDFGVHVYPVLFPRIST